MNEFVCDCMNFRVYTYGLCVCLCVCFPATSVQQRGISGPDVCDLWCGRSCGGEASNVLDIMSHRWRPTAFAPSGFDLPFLSSTLTALFLHMYVCVCGVSPNDDLAVVFSTASSKVALVHMALEDAGCSYAIHVSSTTSEGGWAETQQNGELKRKNKRKKAKMIFTRTSLFPGNLVVST